MYEDKKPKVQNTTIPCQDYVRQTKEQHNQVGTVLPTGLYTTNWRSQTVEELPIVGLHMRERPRSLLYHPVPDFSATSSWTLDVEAYEREVEECAAHNRQVWENALTKLPVELYKQRIHPRPIEQFRTYKIEEGNILTSDNAGNSFYVEDLGQLAVRTGRIITPEVVGELYDAVKADYQPIVDRQLRAFCAAPTPPNTVFRTNINSQPIERYNKRMQLEYLYPCALACIQHNDLSKGNLYKAAVQHRPINGYYYRWYYDNGWTTEVKLIAEQVDEEGNVVNRFTSVKEAVEVLGIPDHAVYRFLRNPFSKDKYGCTWRRIGKTDRAHTYVYDTDRFEVF